MTLKRAADPDRAASMIIETILFDFDGTLAELHIDFSVMKNRIAAVAAGFFGRRPEPDPIPPLEWIEVLVGRLDDGRDGRGRAFRSQAMACIEALELEAAAKGRLFAFTRPVLEELRDRGVNIAVVTRNCEKAVRTVFPDLDRYGLKLFARDHVRRVKPDPEHLRTALKALHAGCRESLMVGDHLLDIETGKRLGVRTAGVASGRVSLADLQAHHPDWAAPDCAALLKVLDAERLLPPKRFLWR